MELEKKQSLEEQLKYGLNKIVPIDLQAIEQAKKRWNSIAKPIGSLGKLEEIVIQLAGISGDAKELSIDKKALLIFCGDHGVVAEGVTQTGSYVTRIVAENFAKNASCVNVMADVARVDVYPIDIGMIGKPYPIKEMVLGEVIHRKIAQGTKNIVKEPAMTKSQCIEAILVGIKGVKELKDKGYHIIATGEMGIGNTTSTSAMASVLLNQSIERVTGRGAGLSEKGLEKKKEVITKILRRHEKEGRGAEPLEILMDIGGYEIAGMVGAFLGGAMYRIPIVMDGVISGIAALTAVAMNQKVKDYIIVSHESKEPASPMIIEELGLEPIIYGDMRLGEGSGAITAIPLISMGVSVYQNMSTFDENEIESYKDYNSKKV